MEREDRTRLHRVEDSFPRLWSWRSIHINHRLKQGEHRGGVVSSAGWEVEVSQMLGKDIYKYEQNYPNYKGELLDVTDASSP